ncbi:MAG TPA: hypothetical protein VGL27_05950 [Negativicutes bacterium]
MTITVFTHDRWGGITCNECTVYWYYLPVAEWVQSLLAYSTPPDLCREIIFWYLTFPVSHR